MRYWQLIAAGSWLIIGSLLYFRNSLISDEAAQGMQSRNWTVATWVAFFLFAWNLARWYQAHTTRRRTNRPVNPPLQTDRPRDRPYEYNPELDFQKPDQSTRDA